MKNVLGMFFNSNESSPYNANFVATKLYPYPMGVADFINIEVQELLENGVVTIQVADKKGKDVNWKNKKRLVKTETRCDSYLIRTAKNQIF